MYFVNQNLKTSNEMLLINENKKMFNVFINEFQHYRIVFNNV